MMIQKKDRFKHNGGKVYEVAGKWGRDFILTPIDDSDDECIIHTPGEMEEFLEIGYFKRVGGEKVMKALFGRKVCNLKELRQITHQAIKEGQKGQPYTITREVILKDAEFKEFAQDFLKDQLWITAEDGGINQNGEVRCIRVVNIETGEKILLNGEGYSYGRYVGLEF